MTTNRPSRIADRSNIADALCGVFDSQISGGKRYDSRIRGRQLANATFHDPRGWMCRKS